MKDKLWTHSFIAACCANFLMFLAFYMLLPILPMYLAEEFDINKMTAGFILASYTIMALLFRPFAGLMVDSFPRKPLLLICFTFFVAYFGGYMLASTLVVFTILRATHGLAFGMVTVSANTVAIDIMPASRRGEGIGFFGISTSLAMAIGPMVALMIHERMPNYDWIFALALGFGILGLCVATLIQGAKPVAVVKTKSDIENRPKTLSLDRFLLLKGTRGAVTTMLISFAYGVLSTYVAVYGNEELGMSNGTALFFVCLSGGLIVSRFASGKLINRGYLTLVSKVGISILIIGFLCFAVLKTPFWFYGCGVIIGIGYGLLCPTLQTMFINLAENNKRGTANATYLTSWDLGLGSGALLGGVIAQYYSYSAAFLLGAILLGLGLITFIAWTGPYFNRNKLR